MTMNAGHNPAEIGLRPAADADRGFAYEVKKAALRAYVEPIWGWDEKEQVEFHRGDWDRRRPEIIQLAGRDIGTVEIWRREADVHLGEFYLFPEFQNRGIGSQVLARVIADADGAGLPIRLEVLKNNPVQSLYRRAAFINTGETSTHILMERRPAVVPK